MFLQSRVGFAVDCRSADPAAALVAARLQFLEHWFCQLDHLTDAITDVSGSGDRPPQTRPAEPGSDSGRQLPGHQLEELNFCSSPAWKDTAPLRPAKSPFVVWVCSIELSVMYRGDRPALLNTADGTHLCKPVALILFLNYDVLLMLVTCWPYQLLGVHGSSIKLRWRHGKLDLPGPGVSCSTKALSRNEK